MEDSDIPDTIPTMIQASISFSGVLQRPDVFEMLVEIYEHLGSGIDSWKIHPKVVLMALDNMWVPAKFQLAHHPIFPGYWEFSGLIEGILIMDIEIDVGGIVRISRRHHTGADFLGQYGTMHMEGSLQAHICKKGDCSALIEEKSAEVVTQFKTPSFESRYINALSEIEEGRTVFKRVEQSTLNIWHKIKNTFNPISRGGRETAGQSTEL